jgi:hypothetical protein
MIRSTFQELCSIEVVSGCCSPTIWLALLAPVTD